MSVYQNCANFFWIEVLKTLDDYVSGLPFVVGFNLLVGHGASDRDFVPKVVGMGRAEAGDSAAGLRKSNRISRVSVDNGANITKRLKQTTMGRRIR